MDWRRRKIARGEYEIAGSSAREANGLMRAARTTREPRARPPIDLFVMRAWQLPCECGHVGTVRATATQMRRWMAEQKLVCQACGTIKRPPRASA